VGRDAGGLDAVAARREVVFKQMDLGLDDCEFIAEVAQTVVVAAVTLDFGGGIPIVKISDGAAECVKGGSGSVE
jgi:hypothetical protein